MSINTDYYNNTSYYAQQTEKKIRKPLTSLIDSDGDKNLSSEEITAFSTAYSEKTGTSLDLSSLINTYDSDGNGSLDESEQESMNKEKAMEQLMASVNPFHRMKMMEPPPKPNEDISIEAGELREKTNETIENRNELLAKKEEDETISEETQSTKASFLNRLTKSISTYEKSFWFENTANTNKQYGV